MTRDEKLMQRALDALELSIPMGSDVTANLELTKHALRKRLCGRDAEITGEKPRKKPLKSRA